MDNSTENVTLFAVFINDILRNYEEKKEDYEELFAMTEGHDLSDPFNKVPIQLYNDLCAWIEDNLGKFNLIRVGRNVGETVYDSLIQNNLLSESSTPLDTMEALKGAAETMVQDDKMRGWEILEHTDNSIMMRRTQTFNSQLQIGLLDGLVRKTKKSGVKVEYSKKIEDGADFDEYIITWF
ncbi:MAG TPA: hypothetical protein DCS93_15430 [Microscillaceae bacterium]|nr:hypothetical protein [Microscillaceae bacterium]